MLTPIRYVILFFLVLSMGCSGLYGKESTYEKGYDFSSLKTYNWIPAKASADQDQYILDYIKERIDLNMESKGYRLDKSAPDFLVVMHPHSKGRKIVTYSSAAGGGFTVSGIPQEVTYEEGTLVLYFLDPETKKPMWRGSIKAELVQDLTPEGEKKLINEAVKSLLKNFPP